MATCPRTHRLTHTHSQTNKPPRAGVRLVGHLYNSVVTFRHITINISASEPRNAKKIAAKKVLMMLMPAWSGRNYNFCCINVVFCVFLHESAPTATKNRTNLSRDRRSCRKPLDPSGPNLTHVCRFIWEWTSAKKN